MELYKPLIKWKAKGFMIMLLLAGLVMIGLGVYFSFFQGRDYVKTTAVIESIRTEEGVDAEGHLADEYYPTVRYSVAGKDYHQELGFWQDGWDIGSQVKIKYDPQDPAKVTEDSLGVKLYLLIVGGLVTAFALFSLLRSKRVVKQLREENPDRPVFSAPRTGAVDRKLYFVTDTGTVKGSCHIEDENRKVLYEAVCTKFSLSSEVEYQFVDHVLGRSVTHLAGKTVTSSSNGLFVLDNHSTFNFDGVDIWKLLHENGVSIRTGSRGLHFTYNISRGGAEIAVAESCSSYVHEEDEEAHKVLSKVPAAGYYRIRTREENLDAIFLTLFAIGRTDMMIFK